MSLVLSNSHHQFQWGHQCRDDNHHLDDDDNYNMFNVFLKMWDGKTLCCVINAHQAAIVNVVVRTLEKKVMEQYPTMNRKNFFFEVGGKPLSTTTDTTAFLLHNGSTVFVQYRNRGGCFMVSLTVMMTIFALILSSTCTCGTSLLLVPLLLPFLFVLPLFCL